MSALKERKGTRDEYDWLEKQLGVKYEGGDFGRTSLRKENTQSPRTKHLLWTRDGLLNISRLTARLRRVGQTKTGS